jgi:hypothetical protein
MSHDKYSMAAFFVKGLMTFSSDSFIHAVETLFIGTREELVGPRLEGAVAMAQREGEADDGDAPDADGLVPVPKHEPRSPQVRASSTRHRALRRASLPSFPSDLGSRVSRLGRRTPRAPADLHPPSP